MHRLEILSSSSNPLIQDVRRAMQRGSLTERGLCIAEGFHLLAEAERSARPIACVLVRESSVTRAQSATRATLTPVTDKLFDSIAATETTQGVMALVEPPSYQAADIFRSNGPIVVLDQLQDPGNAGAIARAAEAFGASGMLFLNGTAHPFHPKTLRASAGSLFRLPLLTGLDPAAVLSLAAHHQRPCYAAVAGGARTADEAELSVCLLIVGNEGRGVSEALRQASLPVSIPTHGVESLNAAVSASILLYEAQRQRQPR